MGPLASVVLAAWIAGASAWAEPPLATFSTGGIFFTYPQAEEGIARRLAAAVPEMRRVLAAHQLAIQTPLHVVLDQSLDEPAPLVHVIPHREIRIPLKAPGVFEDGWLEPDPWRYVLFKGLCLQAIYTLRSGLPAVVHRVFGEIISPNVILPDWMTDGVCHLLYRRYSPGGGRDPLNETLFRLTAIPDLDTVSNHSEAWPGHFSYRIFGRPFVRWIESNHG